MSARTWMPMYWGDYLRDTSHLTQGQHGAYLLLIGHYWVKGSLPAMHEQCYCIARAMDEQSKANVDAVIAEFFVIDDGKYTHKRIDEEISKAAESHEKRAKAAKKRWQKSADESNENAKHDALHEHARPFPHPYPDSSSLRSEPSDEGAGDERTRNETKPKQTKGSRLPSGSLLPIEWEQWAASEGHRDPQREWKSFHDYWVGVPGQKGVKLDWEATWRNWVRRSLERNTPARQSRPPPGSGTSFVTQAFDDLDESLFTRRGQ